MPEQWVWIQNLRILQVSGYVWCLIPSRVFKCVLVCCYCRVSRKKRIVFCIEKQQKSIDWLIGDTMIINTCIAQHMIGNAVRQQRKQYHLQLHCTECWQLLQNPLLGKWGKWVLQRRGIWTFFTCIDTFKSPSLISEYPTLFLIAVQNDIHISDYILWPSGVTCDDSHFHEH